MQIYAFLNLIRLTRSFSVLIGSVGFFHAAVAADYYVSLAGNNSNAGTSESSPWRSVWKVNSNSYFPRDRILFRGGDVFPGKLSFSSGTKGTASSPVQVASYGAGRATIYGGAGEAFSANNTAGIHIHDINFVGSGSTSNKENGVIFYADLGGDVKLQFLSVERVDIGGFGKSGLVIGSWNGKTGFNDVYISSVGSHDNANIGVFVFGEALYANTNVYLKYIRAYNNTGIAGESSSTGSGILLSSVNGGVIERSLAYNNGALNTAVGGPVGIWTYDSTNIVIQYNESYKNKTNSTADGGGFDLDGGVSNSILQYNYSHDNAGAGYLLCQYSGASPVANNIVRYNISQNDGRKNGYGGITLYSTVDNTDIYNNTVFMSEASSGSPPAIRMWNWDGKGLRFRNNLIITSGNVPVIAGNSGSGLYFQGNNYWSETSQLKFRFDGTSYTSLQAFRSSTAQEMLNGKPSGLSVVAELSNAGGGTTIGNPNQLTSLLAYKLLPASPMIDAGINLPSVFGNNVGNSDFYDGALPQESGYDIGAHERAP